MENWEKQKLFEIRWKRDNFSQEVGVQLKGKS